MVANVEGKKIPGFVKKLNKFLGLPSQSNRVVDILLISTNAEKINDNSGSINNITVNLSKNAGNIAKNKADIFKYHHGSYK